MMPELRGVCPLLYVFDMPTSLAFYRDLLGFEIVETAPAADQVSGDDFWWAWLRRGSAELMLNTAYDPDDVRPSEPEAVRVVAHGDTTLYIGCPDVDAAYRHLLALGVHLNAPVIASYGMKQLPLEDPDGFGICFQWPATVRETAAE